MSAPPIPDNVVSGLGVRGAGRGYFSRSIPFSKGGGFSLAAFMAAQSDGFWYDFGQTDRLFQENVGPTPADDPNEVIGLALSSRLWNGRTFAQEVAQAAEVVPVPIAAAGWTLGSGWSISSGALNFSAVSGVNADYAAGLSVGRLYRVTYTIASISGGSISINAGGVAGAARSTAGTYTEYLTADSLTFVRVQPRFGTTPTGSISAISVKEVSRYPATQATGTLKPKYQTTGAAFDGSDDNLLTGYTASSPENFIVAKVTVPATISATQVICGAWVAGPTDFFFLGLSTTGLVRCGVGGVAATASAGSDLRGTEAVIGLSFDATTVRMFAGGAEVNSAPRSGNPTTVTPVRIGATNAAGSASNLFGGSVKSIVAGRQFLDLSTFNKIAAAL